MKFRKNSIVNILALNITKIIRDLTPNPSLTLTEP